MYFWVVDIRLKDIGDISLRPLVRAEQKILGNWFFTMKSLDFFKGLFQIFRSYYIKGQYHEKPQIDTCDKFTLN